MSKSGIKKLGIIGLGRMGKCLLEGVRHAKVLKNDQLFFTTRHDETGKRISDELGIQRCASNSELVDTCDTVLLAVKPQNTKEVSAEIKSSNLSGKTLISIVASISTQQLESQVGGGACVIRAMPNTPAFVREGITALCRGANAKESHLELAETLFKPLGRVVRVDERHMDAVTGLSGCGPAYIYMIMDALTEGGIKVGIPRELATELSAQTVLGAAKMLLETGRHPASLKDEVTTPAGCTIDGLVELEEGKLRITLMKAVVSATERAKTLSSGS